MWKIWNLNIKQKPLNVIKRQETSHNKNETNHYNDQVIGEEWGVEIFQGSEVVWAQSVRHDPTWWRCRLLEKEIDLLR